jgi:hypothetical protein
MAKKKAKKAASAASPKKKTKVKETELDRKAPKEPKAKKATKRKSRAKDAGDARVKLFWGVYNHAMKRVALYDFNQKKAAEKRAKELSAGGKPPHFVAKVKEPVTA